MANPPSQPDPDRWAADRALVGDPRGRGSRLAPKNRFDRLSLHVLPDERDRQLLDSPEGVQVATQVIDDDTREILNRVDSPDLPFHWTVNPYRGCEHGCIYCYARPGHEYLGLNAGLDFETKIHAKRTAPELLRKALTRDAWQGEPIVLSGVTDPYQPIERELQITRACLTVISDLRQPVSFVTKNKLILRDLDLIAPMAERRLVNVYISLTSLDNTLSSRMEPRASNPKSRLQAIRELSNAGVPVGVMTAPIIPGLNDREIPALLQAAGEAGARTAAFVTLRLPLGVADLFQEWLVRHYPDRAEHVLSLIRQCRGGALNDARSFSRMRGEGPIAEQIAQTHKLFRKRFALTDPMRDFDREAFARAKASRAGVQRSLFE